MVLADAIGTFQANGLMIWPFRDGVLIGLAIKTDDGKDISREACLLVQEGDEWICSIPSTGGSAHAVRGPLRSLVPIIIDVCDAYLHGDRVDAIVCEYIRESRLGVGRQKKLHENS